MDYQDMFLFLLCHTNTGILGYQSLPPNTRPKKFLLYDDILVHKEYPGGFYTSRSREQNTEHDWTKFEILMM